MIFSPSSSIFSMRDEFQKSFLALSIPRRGGGSIANGTRRKQEILCIPGQGEEPTMNNERQCWRNGVIIQVPEVPAKIIPFPSSRR